MERGRDNGERERQRGGGETKGRERDNGEGERQRGGGEQRVYIMLKINSTLCAVCLQQYQHCGSFCCIPSVQLLL